MIKYYTLIAIMCLFVSCALLGVGETTVDPSQELRTELETVKKEVDKSNKQYEDIQGSVTSLETRISEVNTNVNTVQSQVTESTQNNESLKSLMITLGIIWAGIVVLSFVLHIIKAKVAPGATIGNILFPWRMAKK